MLRQRIYAIAANYEDLNDHDYLRHDLAFQTVINKNDELASSPTLCRLENRITRAECVAMNINLVEQFIRSYKVAPQELILDFDPTDYKLYGHQEGRHYHGYYEDYYCPRGDMENYIKQQKLDLRADRVSCSHFTANQFRMLLSAYAYVLLSKLRNEMLRNTKFERAYCATLRSQLIKIGAIVIKNTRRVRFLFSSHFTQQELFADIISRLVPS